MPQSVLPGQDHFRGLLTDDKLRVLGSGGTIWAIGDAATIAAPRALDHVDELFEQADKDGSGTLSLRELRVRAIERTYTSRALRIGAARSFALVLRRLVSVQSPILFVSQRAQRRVSGPQDVLKLASKRFPQFEEHARFLNTKTGGTNRFGGLVHNAFAQKKTGKAQEIFGEVDEESVLSRDEFSQLLKTIDLGLRALPATAQARARAHPLPAFSWI